MAITSLAERAPATRFVINDLGLPSGVYLAQSTAEELLAEWRRAIAGLAHHENIYVKLSGCLNPMFNEPAPVLSKLAHSPSPASTAAIAEAYRPLVLAVIDGLGPERCMFESNFPVAGAHCEYATLWNAFKLAVFDRSHEDLAWLFHRSAIAAYALDPGLVS